MQIHRVMPALENGWIQNIIKIDSESISQSSPYLDIDFAARWSLPGLSKLSCGLIFDVRLSKLLHISIFKGIELNFAVMYVWCVNYFTNIFSPFIVVNNLKFTSPHVDNFCFGTIVVINKELTPRCVIVVIIWLPTSVFQKQLDMTILICI